MTPNRRANRFMLLAIVVAALFAAGIVHLFRLRFEAGDIYPPYSSLRSDPLGTRALYQSYASCSAGPVSRNYKPITQLDLQPQTALFFLGDSVDFSAPIPRYVAAALTRDIRRGARLVVSLKPRNWSIAEESDEDGTGDDPDADTESEGEEEDGEKEEEETDTLPTEVEDDTEQGITFTEWLGLAVEDVPIEGTATAVLDPSYGSTGLPREVSCHSSVCFKDLTNGWRVVYARDDKPVIVERSMRSGTIVLSALSFFVSNEALRYERHPALLTWLAGDARRMVFDEYHLGIVRAPGLAALLRRYRLHAFGAGLLLLAVLFVWKNSVFLVPVHAEPSRETGPTETGHGSRSALVNILRRNVPASSILETAFEEWQRGANLNDATTRQRVADASRLIEAQKSKRHGPRHASDTYDRLCRILNPPVFHE